MTPSAARDRSNVCNFQVESSPQRHPATNPTLSDRHGPDDSSKPIFTSLAQTGCSASDSNHQCSRTSPDFLFVLLIVLNRGTHNSTGQKPHAFCSSPPISLQSGSDMIRVPV